MNKNKGAHGNCKLSACSMLYQSLTSPKHLVKGFGTIFGYGKFMKELLSLLLVVITSASFSQEMKIERTLFNNNWLLTNGDKVNFSNGNIQGSDGYFEIRNDSMIVARHCYQWETYHKIVHITNDSLVLQVYNRVWKNQEDSITIEPTDKYYYFKILDITDEEYKQLTWTFKKKILHLTKK